MKKKITQLTKVILVASMVLISGAAFSQTTLLEEIFTIEGGELDSDSASFSAMPEGWMVKNCYSSGKNNYDLSETDESVAILFKSNDSYLITPAVNKPGILTFWAKQKAALEGGVLIVEKSIDGGDFVEVESISTLGDEHAEFTVAIDDLSSNVKIKFSSYSGDDVNEYKFYVDNVILMESTMVGIEAQSIASDLTIVGNYVDNNLKFETTANNGQLTIVDMIGRVVLQNTYTGTNNLDVSTLNTGSYIIALNSESGMSTAKFYKK